MINTWGVCEFGGIYTTQMLRGDLCCKYFSPKEREDIKSTGKCCANCIYWITFDEPITEQEK